MLSIVKTMSLNGIDGYLVEVQTDVSSGLPSFNVVGLPDISIKESKERVRACIKNYNIEIPSRKILVNLSPADQRKEGTGFDLPIAVGILMSVGIVDKNKVKDLENTIFIGELSLDGKINKVKGILPMCIESKKLGIKRVIVPKLNSKEAAIVSEIDVIPVNTLKEVIDYINGNLIIEKQKTDISQIFKGKNKYNIDFNEVKGQENVKRALEISASGWHNCLMIGSPRSRKKYDFTKNSNNIARFNI